ncbi:MAG: hypothetical protein WA880_14440 [Ornithinimicrobium sp.]
MPTSEDDVLDLMNRAAMDPPSMHLSPRSVLASAQGRRRKQRQTRGGMALAGLAAAAAVWVGAGSGLGDLVGTGIDPAGNNLTPTEWDDSVSFEAPLPNGGGSFTRSQGSLVRTPGDDFVVEFADGSPTLVPLEAQLPPGVELFTHDEDTLLVSEPRFDATPVPGFNAFASSVGAPGLSLTDEDQEVFLWFLDEDTPADEVRDVYWLMPDQVISSTGATVISEVVAEGDDEVTVVIVPETQEWGQRTSSGLGRLSPVTPPGDDVALDPAQEGDLWVSVIPGWAQNPMFSPPDSYDAQPMSTRVVGDYLVVWAISNDSGDEDGRPAMVGWDRPASMGLTETSTVTVDPREDEIRVSVEGTKSELTVAAEDTEARAVEPADGSALVIAPLPDGISSVDGPSGPATAEPQSVFRMYNAVVANREEAGTKLGTAMLPGEDRMVAVGLPSSPGVERDPDVKILPTLLFQGEQGPQWAGGGKPANVDVAGTQIRVAIETDLDIWAADCDALEPGTATGDTGSPVVSFLECIDPGGSSTPNGIAVLVLPTDVAATARLLPRPDREQDEDLPDPIVTDLGDGLSFWAVPLGPMGTGIFADREFVDLDGDGTVDEPPPVAD